MTLTITETLSLFYTTINVCITNEYLLSLNELLFKAQQSVFSHRIHCKTNLSSLSVGANYRKAHARMTKVDGGAHAHNTYWRSDFTKWLP